jgi:DNA-binding response OmpR family regulator
MTMINNTDPDVKTKTVRARILVLDHESALLDLITDCLAAHRYSVCTANTAAEALRRLADDQFHCIVTGLDKPLEACLEFSRSARAIRPNIPLLLTTDDHRVSWRLIQDSGFCCILFRPFDFRVLVEQIRSALNEKG